MLLTKRLARIFLLLLCPLFAFSQQEAEAIAELKDAMLNQRSANPLTLDTYRFDPLSVISALESESNFTTREEAESYLRALRYFIDTYDAYDEIKEVVVASMVRQYRPEIKGMEFLIFRYALNGTQLSQKNIIELSKVIRKSPLALNYYGMLAKYIPADTLIKLARKHYPTLDKCYPAAASLSSIYKTCASDAQMTSKLIDEYVHLFDSVSCKDKISIGFFFRNFKKLEFSEQQKEKISTIVEKYQYVSLVQLAGYLDLTNLKAVLENSALNHEDMNVRWYSHLALARMGDEKHIQYCMGQIAQVSLTDIMTIYVDDLAYMRSPESFKLLSDLLFSDLKNNEKAEEEEKMYAELVAQTLEGKIIDFPKIGNNMTSAEFLPIARKWMQEHKNNFELRKDCF
jgi:hypothetical protein